MFLFERVAGRRDRFPGYGPSPLTGSLSRLSPNLHLHVSRVNRAILDRVSHKLTAFPSGHVAVCAAAAIAIVPLSVPLGLTFGVVAAGVAVGAAAGRYHYVMDVAAGILLGFLAAGAAGLATGKPWGDTMTQATEQPPEDAVLRHMMVETQLAPRGILDRRVLDAMRRVPRERFVPLAAAAHAYDDGPLSIGFGQTISQPYIVAYMSEALRTAPDQRVLEIGTGSGYQAAVLGELVREVYSIEIVPELARRAAGVLDALGYTNVHVREGDGYGGWPDHAPFDRILLTAAPEAIPQPLIDQLAPDGLLIAPVGASGATQWIVIVEKRDGAIVQRRTIPVQFVPFTRRN